MTDNQSLALVMIGAPGSGKTTEAHRLAQLFCGDVISYDGLREELWGDESIQGDWVALRGVLADRLSSSVGAPVVIDGTHYRRRYRKEVVALLRDFGYDRISGVFMDTPLDLCQLRNARRDRKVPQDLITDVWSIIKADQSNLSKDFDSYTEITPDVDLPEWYG